MNPRTGAEDDPGWGKSLGEKESAVVEICRTCHNKILFWHCANVSCPWCASCSAKSREAK